MARSGQKSSWGAMGGELRKESQDYLGRAGSASAFGIPRSSINPVYKSGGFGLDRAARMARKSTKLANPSSKKKGGTVKKSGLALLHKGELRLKPNRSHLRKHGRY